MSKCKECGGSGSHMGLPCYNCNGTGCEPWDGTPSGRYLLSEEEIDTMADAIRDGDVFETMERIMTQRIDLCLADQKDKTIKRIKELEPTNALEFLLRNAVATRNSYTDIKKDVIQFVIQVVEKDI